MREQIDNLINRIIETNEISSRQIAKAKSLVNLEEVTLLTQGNTTFSLLINDGDEKVEVKLCADPESDNGHIYPVTGRKESEWDEYSLAALYMLKDNTEWLDPDVSGKKYTREGMIKRVLEERRDKARTAEYRVKLADNIYGEHTLYNEKGDEYKITLRDFDNETGYIDNIDLRTNKLGTTKHIMFMFDYLKSHPRIYNRLSKTYPFVEIYLDPLNDYKISWFYPHKLENSVKTLLKTYFGNSTFIEDDKMSKFLGFLHVASDYDIIKIRQEVPDKIERHFNKNMIESLKSKFTPDYSVIKSELFPYQKEGVEFCLFKQGAIIADEMGLGKTIQAIAVSIFKKQLFDFDRTLIICPASLKHQWKSEIEKFSHEKAIVVEGLPEIRKKLYFEPDTFFFIVNYETVLRDLQAINAAGFDFVILDEAQKIKNYETKTAYAIKAVEKKQSLVITGTPIENKLIDLFSIMQFIDIYYLTPLWEFSYQHCIFDHQSKNRIVGYYNLNALKQRMSSILIRREKQQVLKQLPNVTQHNVPVTLHERQATLHAGFGKGIAKILRKKFKTAYDWQRLMLLLTNMRMVCDSTFLIDKQTNYSPKLQELKHILLEKLDMKNNNRKVIIFSEWINMLHLIGEELKEIGLDFVMLTGKIPVKKRGLLIETFEKDDNCRVFLSTEAGGSGLNLQMADTVINFELPWNPAKKNQRIGRIDRLGQKHKKLTVFNLMSYGTIEHRISLGLMLKQNLFDGVLNEDNIIDTVDFSEKGRSQFIKQLEEMVADFEKEELEVAHDELEEPVGESLEMVHDEELAGSPGAAGEPVPAEGEQGKPSSPQKQRQQQYAEMEQVLNKGMEFLAGVFKMATGKDMNTGNKSNIEIDKNTGEVVMRFKLEL